MFIQYMCSCGCACVARGVCLYRSSVPVTLQANKSLLMKAMQQAEQSVAKARQHLCMTCLHFFLIICGCVLNIGLVLELWLRYRAKFGL